MHLPDCDMPLLHATWLQTVYAWAAAAMQTTTEPVWHIGYNRFEISCRLCLSIGKTYVVLTHLSVSWSCDHMYIFIGMKQCHGGYGQHVPAGCEMR